MHLKAALPGMMRVGPLVKIPQVLKSFGVDPAGLLSEFGIALETFVSDNSIQFVTLGELLLRCSERTGSEYFGLLVGSQAQPEHFGLVGELMRNAPTLGAAITDWASNQHRFVRGSVIQLLKHDDVTIMTYRVHQANVVGITQILETAVAAGYAVLRDLSGEVPVEVWLPRKPPAEPEAYRRVFRIKPRHDVSVGGLAYSLHALAQPIPGADARRRLDLEAQVREYRTIDIPTFADQVRRQLGARITTGTTTKAEIALELGVHEREIGRRLLKAGTTFRNLKNEACFEVACQLLANTELSVAAIANALHYNDASAFVKAFQLNAELSPLTWRERSHNAVAARSAEQ